jgi:hypothetical protein
MLCIVVFEALFLKVPLENEYLLPMLPFALILIGVLLRDRRKALIGLVCVQLSYAMININLARPDQENHATDATVGLWIEPGYVVHDTRKRLAEARRVEARRAEREPSREEAGSPSADPL